MATRRGGAGGQKAKSLSEKLLDLVRPDPEDDFQGEEDALNGGTKLDSWSKSIGDDLSDLPKSNLRMLADQSLTEGRYAGRRVSRSDFDDSIQKKQLDEDDEDDSGSGDDFDDDEEDDDDDDDGEDSDLDEDDDSDEGGMDSALFDKAYQVESSLKKIRDQEQKRSTMKLLTESKDEKEKAEHATNQRAIWDSVLHIRIQQQRVLGQVNKLPQNEMLEAFADHDPNIRSDLQESSQTIQTVLKDLLQFSWGLFQQNPELLECYDNFWDDEKKKLEDEIHTTLRKKAKTDQEKKARLDLVDKLESIGKKRKRIANFDADVELQLIPTAPPKKKQQKTNSDQVVDHWWEQLELLREAQEPFIDQIVDRWNRKTQLSGNIEQTKFKAINQNILSQVESAMRQKEKLIQKTQLWRRGPDDLPFGKPRKVPEKPAGTASSSASSSSASAKLFSKPTVESIVAKERVKKDKSEINVQKNQEDIIDFEIFDDSDFYQELLKELIEMEASDDPHQGLALTRAWLKSKQNPKVRRDIDTRASKGRKIRYLVHEKLVNFMTPSEEPYPHFVDDLFTNLFAE